MSLAELCDAAITRSDNTAGNALMKDIGDPSVDRLCAGHRRQCDELDRTEIELNEVAPGDPRDTTTPNAMAANFKRLLLGNALVPEGRDQLVKWLMANKTGDSRLRAGLPQGWGVGAKTGAGEHGTTNDVASYCRPASPPIRDLLRRGARPEWSEMMRSHPLVERSARPLADNRVARPTPASTLTL